MLIGPRSLRPCSELWELASTVAAVANVRCGGRCGVLQHFFSHWQWVAKLELDQPTLAQLPIRQRALQLLLLLHEPPCLRSYLVLEI